MKINFKKLVPYNHKKNILEKESNYQITQGRSKYHDKENILKNMLLQENHLNGMRMQLIIVGNKNFLLMRMNEIKTIYIYIICLIMIIISLLNVMLQYL